MAWTNKRLSELPPDWHAIRGRVLKRDGRKCVKCGDPANQVDHIQRGNNHSLSNLQSLCESCHKTKTLAESIAARREIAQRLRKPPEAHPGLLQPGEEVASNADAEAFRRIAEAAKPQGCS